MFVIKGYYWLDESEKIVCTFDSEKAAKNYIKKSRLKNPRWEGPFRKKSLLSDYSDAWVEVLEENIHNPEVNW